MNIGWPNNDATGKLLNKSEVCTDAKDKSRCETKKYATMQGDGHGLPDVPKVNREFPEKTDTI